MWYHCRLTSASCHAGSPSKPRTCRNPSPITSNIRAAVACAVVRRPSPAPVIRAVTQQHVALGRQHLGRGNRRSSSPESPQLLCTHRGCSQTMREAILGHVMGVVRIYCRCRRAQAEWSKCGDRLTCAAPVRLVQQVTHAYCALGWVLGLLEDQISGPSWSHQARRALDLTMTVAATDACFHPTSK